MPSRTASLRTALLALLIVGSPALVAAVTLRDIIELSRAGVPDSILTALIDADRTVVTLDAAQVLQLQDERVSEAVVLKMLGTRREFDAASAVPAVAPPAADALEPAGVADAPIVPPPDRLTVIVPYPVVVPYLMTIPASAPCVHTPRRAATAPGGLNMALPIRNGEFVKPDAVDADRPVGLGGCATSGLQSESTAAPPHRGLR